MTLASMGSYSVPTTVPSESPESTRTWGRPVGSRSRAPSRRREEASPGVLGVDPGLDGVARAARTLCPAQGSGSPSATRSCHSTRSTPEDGFGHGVLDLETGVHFHEEVLVGTVCRHDELDRPRAHIAACLGGGRRR